MADKTLTTSLQQSVLTLLCMDDDKGGIAANLVTSDLFEPPYDDIVAKALSFRKKFKQAPGDAHLDDLFDHVLSDKKNKKKRLYETVLGDILEQSEHLNPDYVLSRVNEFIRAQTVKSAILEAAERFQNGGDDVVAEAENILHTGLRFKPEAIDAGVYMSDRRNIEWIMRSSHPDFYFGIDELDERGIGLTRGEAVGLLAKKKAGKTTCCVHVGTKVAMQGGRVLHISLEVRNERLGPRYLRRMFAIGKNREKFRQTFLKKDELGRVVGFTTKMRRAKTASIDKEFASSIEEKMADNDPLLKRIKIATFPTKSLTMARLTAYLDNLEITDGFVPDLLILDYPKLMDFANKQDLRIGLGETVEKLRGLCGERNFAGFFPMQSNREGEEAALLTGKHQGEDYSQGQTLDGLLSYNQTPAEKMLGLARLHVEAWREEKDGFSVLITQDYGTGQFVKQSAYIPNDYNRLIKEETDGED